MSSIVTEYFADVLYDFWDLPYMLVKHILSSEKNIVKVLLCFCQNIFAVADCKWSKFGLSLQKFSCVETIPTAISLQFLQREHVLCFASRLRPIQNKLIVMKESLSITDIFAWTPSLNDS